MRPRSAHSNSAAARRGEHPKLLDSLALPAGARHHAHSIATRHDTRASTTACRAPHLAPGSPRIAPGQPMTEPPKLEDLDPVETREWLESIDSVLKTHGPERAHFLLERLIDYTRRSGAYLPFKPNTAYVNSIAAGREPEYPGNRALERRIEAYIRWNALAMVLAANRRPPNTADTWPATPPRRRSTKWASITSGARPPSSTRATWSSSRGIPRPGIYARAYLEGRLREEQLQRFRQEASGPGHGSVLLSASVADAGLLAVPDRVDGLRSHDGDLPGALHALPRAPRPREALRPEGLGVPRRWRDG